MSADPSKIKAIATAGCPQTTNEVKSFLQACQYNAKFMFDSGQAYAQVTQPLRQLTGKNIRFAWTPACESAYQEILRIMTAETALRPFNPSMKTIMVSNAGPVGIAASIFQEEEASTWTPVDHASRSLTPCEQAYAQIEKESLAQSWGMNTRQYYLLGIPFDSYTDHQPLIPIYSASRKPAPARVERHRLQVQDFQYTMQYIPGKSNPCDYPSHHPIPLADYTASEIADMVINQADELGINKIITGDLPDTVTLPMIQQTAKQDLICQKLITCITKGHITEDPTLKPYRQVFQELTYTNGILLRGDKLLIPDAEPSPGAGTLWKHIVDIAHEGHQGTVKCKQLL